MKEQEQEQEQGEEGGTNSSNNVQMTTSSSDPGVDANNINTLPTEIEYLVPFNDSDVIIITENEFTNDEDNNVLVNDSSSSDQNTNN